MTSLLRYDRDKTFAQFDAVSFEHFADAVKLSPKMRLMFTTFARAFFAEPQYISMAELNKSFILIFSAMTSGSYTMFLTMI